MGKKCVMGRGKRAFILLAKRVLIATAIGCVAPFSQFVHYCGGFGRNEQLFHLSCCTEGSV